MAAAMAAIAAAVSSVTTIAATVSGAAAIAPAVSGATAVAAIPSVAAVPSIATVSAVATVTAIPSIAAVPSVAAVPAIATVAAIPTVAAIGRQKRALGVLQHGFRIRLVELVSRLWEDRRGMARSGRRQQHGRCQKRRGQRISRKGKAREIGRRGEFENP
ncbi:hypothetical protein [Mesorhizobium sp. M2A.F.Ca.ET.029.05.1.1]|uniref:hypothetical protein n=1 Tax=Mesorhizobium sp. M2A.F.Ca.ET.029.05.1.1 TaxID=2496658 RepID=UPI0016746565|nr:hypothetical protein [Mesorhizobium sp. M2A.F.Ca.ET.029.05.1.1]